MAPVLCSTFKGVLPSDLFDRYDREGGFARLEFDLSVAAEIGDRITEQVEESKGKADAKSAVARRNQRREAQKTDAAGLAGVLNDWMGED